MIIIRDYYTYLQHIENKKKNKDNAT